MASPAPFRKSVGRNVYGDAPKEKYVDLRLSQRQTDGNSLACSSELIASCWETGGGGTLGIIATDCLGKRNPPVTLFRGHKGPIQDIHFSPFYTTIFATASEDSTVKLWDCPRMRDDEPQRDSVATLTGHAKRVSLLSFNPVAEWIVATASTDGTMKVWDFEVQKCVHTAHFAGAQSLEWNYTASLLACTTKERLLKIYDPRQPLEVGSLKAHEGAKPTKCVWLQGPRVGTDNLLLTTGFSKMADRQFALWDIRKLDASVQQEDIDRQAGAIQPVFDAGTGLLFLAGKGDGNIRFYEAIDGIVTKVGVYQSITPAHELAYIEKRGVDVMRCEVMRAYKKESDSVIQPISFIVPRRNMSEFQEELFPPCPSGDPSLSAEEWLGGQSSPPLLGSMAPVNGESPFKKNKRPINVGNLLFSRQRESTAVSSAPSVLQKRMTMQGKALSDDLEHLRERIGQLEQQVSLQTELIKDKDAEIERLIAELSKERNKMASPRNALDDIAEHEEYKGPVRYREIVHSSTPLAEPQPPLTKLPSTELTATRLVLKETQAEARLTQAELQKLRQETSALTDVGKMAKEQLELVRRLAYESKNTSQHTIDSSRTPSKSSGSVHIGGESRESRRRRTAEQFFSEPRSTEPRSGRSEGEVDDGYLDRLLQKLIQLESRNKELENLFLTLRTASKVERKKSSRDDSGDQEQIRANGRRVVIDDAEMWMPQQERRYYSNMCVPGLSACRGL
eukprot:Blabericola_migrator_1__4981@NODE_258_length_10736_cov_58_864373_g216_i0_p2_GENE_NODE_258_length_10736_cov_58_864373_g216_i0NODE_258_length_10736_cov_58_864373_g216_i0_p2_ORF_typecomplete_len734_score114_50WD40/PF00400_32/6_1e08WD40/PF00400_32/2e07WD40/PF00400_32/4_7e03ANAPC4_WD40/PF12894_7/0_00023ANAPC4_WD40/PF12894_7/7_3e06ANAPC4_WD40/PF12894_7/8_6e07ANAPC4_WD40/PF12894_7/3_8e02WD40_4/PF16300_5/2_5e16Ge1_WD40/PF16529_5/0_0016Ge1_WD40/PF16529_5/0_00044eIF2A/PF08662_11/1_6e09eIF2A/PF08662_11/1_5